MRKSCRGLVDYIASRYTRVAEIGIGSFPDVARAIAQGGVRVFATDTRPVSHHGLRVIVDDVTAPDIRAYHGVDLLYTLRPPAELVPYVVELAGRIGADVIAKPLASEHVGGRLTRHKNASFFLWTFI